MDEAIYTTKIDKGAELRDAGDLPLAPFTDDQILERLTATSVALLTGDKRRARPGPWGRSFCGATLA
jgi:hypothetical protein